MVAPPATRNIKPMRPLILIGYWRSADQPNWPDPAWFIDPEWDPAVRARIVEYLRTGTLARVFCGLSWCRFRCATDIVGSAELTDGRFLWPEGLAHYVEHHGVRLPD